MAKKTSIEIFRELVSELKSGNAKPVYFCSGEEVFFLDRIQEGVVSRVPPDQRDFNLDILYGQDTNTDRILSVCRSFPMMAEKRVVIIRDFFGLAKKREISDDQPNNMDDLIPYFEQPNPNTLLVMFDEKKPSGNTRLGKAIKKNKSVGYFEFNAVPEYRLPEWIIEWTQVTHKKQFDPAAAQYLAQFVGDNLLQLTSEIDKLCTFKKEGEQITQDDIRELVGISKEYSIFELKDAIVQKNKKKALFIADKILQMSDSITGEVIRTVSFFYSMYSNIWQILRLKERGLTPDQIQKKVGISNKFYFNNLMKDARAYKSNEMPRIFEALLDADKAIKGFSKMDPSSIMFFTISKIM